MEEMNPDIFEETDDPDVWQAVLSPQKIKGFQNYLDRLKIEDEKKMLTGDVDKYIQSNPIDEAVTNFKNKKEVSTNVAKDLENEGRGLKGYKPPSEPEKRGYKQDDGGNYSVDTKDDYWQTKKGHDEAVKMYGTKPAWVKEPSLIYNPKTKKYDSIKKEEFVDLKPKKRISL